jgi:hypothetical protein
MTQVPAPLLSSIFSISKKKKSKKREDGGGDKKRERDVEDRFECDARPVDGMCFDSPHGPNAERGVPHTPHTAGINRKFNTFQAFIPGVLTYHVGGRYDYRPSLRDRHVYRVYGNRGATTNSLARGVWWRDVSPPPHLVPPPELTSGGGVEEGGVDQETDGTVVGAQHEVAYERLAHERRQRPLVEEVVEPPALVPRTCRCKARERPSSSSSSSAC